MLTKKIQLLSIICCFSFPTRAQLFEVSNAPVFQKADGSIYSLALAGGLNQVQFSNYDFNNDGRQDLFAFDKSGDKVLIFLAEVKGGGQGYRYAPEYEEYFPKGKQFMRLADYDNDGKADLWMYSGTDVHIYKNTSTTELSLTDMGAQVTQDNVSPDAAGNYTTRRFTHVFGCQPAIVDLDGDTDLDFITNLNINGSNLIYIRSNSVETGLHLSDLSFETPDKCFGGIDEKNGDLTINSPCFYYESYKKKHAASKTLLFFDNDGDGDMDLFYGSSEIETNPLYFFHNNRVELNHYKDTFTVMDTNYFSHAIERQIPVAPNMSYVDINHDGVLDLILSTNENDKTSYPIKERDNVLLFINRGTTDNPDFVFQQNDFLVGEMLDFGSHTAPTFGDLDGDGDMDLILATNGDHFTTLDTSDRLIYFENIGSKTNPVFKLIDEDYLGLSSLFYRGLRPTLADLNGTNKLDLFLGKKDGTIAHYSNTGTASAPSFTLQTENFSNIQNSGNAAPCFYDLNKDGKLDLLVGAYKGNIAYYENSGTASVPLFILKDEDFGDIKVNELILSGFIKPDGSLGDTLLPAPFGNAAPQIIKWRENSIGISVGTHEGKVRIFEIADDLTTTFAEVKDYMQHEFTSNKYIKDWGQVSIPAAADLDGDGISDLLIGNSRGGVSYLKGNKKELNSVRKTAVSQKTFVLAPNPAQSSFIIYTNLNKPFEYTVYSVTGKIVAQGAAASGVSIELNNSLSEGVYIVQIENGTNFYSPQRMIISK